MSQIVYDFAVLGDQQAEGVLSAAALVRKGYSVLLVPSNLLGEMPQESQLPLVLPAQLGHKRLNDLLFRSGFFRLEESGMVIQNFSYQSILPKNRLQFDGQSQQWLSELEREFPHALRTFQSLFQNARKQTPQLLNRLSQELIEIGKRDPSFRMWLEAEVEFALKPSSDFQWQEVLKLWLTYLLKQEPKAFRVDPKLQVPYAQFLVEHARKWGVHVLETPCDFKSSWGAFELTKTHRAANLILNSMGAGRLLARHYSPKFAERYRAWLYWDILDCPWDLVPEPLQELVYFPMSSTDSSMPAHRLLTLKVGRERTQAQISLGTWLSFDDSKTWVVEIEKTRGLFRKLMPFLPDHHWRALPSLLELTEMKGECVRRGMSERLLVWAPKRSQWSRMLSSLLKALPRQRRPHALGRRIYPVHSHYLPFKNRVSSFEQSLSLLEYFERKKRKLSKAI